MGDISKYLNMNETTCKSIPNTKTPEARVGDGTCIHIACILLPHPFKSGIFI